jgi:hypothetical protein
LFRSGHDRDLGTAADDHHDDVNDHDHDNDTDDHDDADGHDHDDQSHRGVVVVLEL